MRKLGVRLPEPPPVETDVENSSNGFPHEISAEERELVEVYRLERKPMNMAPVVRSEKPVVADTPPDPLPDPVLLPHERFTVDAQNPVEVHRIERNPVEVELATHQVAAVETHAEPLAEPASSLPEHAPIANPRPLEEERLLVPAPIGRWEEFHDRRDDEPERDDRIHLAPMPLRPGSSSTLLTADLEREHRSSFLTLAVLGIAALLAIGAAVWSGSLRYRVRQQNAAMNALQEQNQKLAETLAQKGAEQKSGEQISGSQTAGEQKATSASDSGPDAPQNPVAPAKPAIAPTKTRQPANRQGIATPPPVQQKGAQYRRLIEPERAPEIVPPYPTLSKPGNVAANASNSQPVPNAGAYRPPFTPGANQQPVPVAGSARPAPNAGTASRTSVPQASPAPRLPAAPPASPSAPVAAPSESVSQYTPTGNGEYVSPLAQNIEAVEGLQRHSPVQLREFHARAGASTQATPNVRLAVQPDQGRGSYALLVSSGGSSYQLHGTLNQPLAFTDTATHREYALVILNIAGQQVYGFVRANVKQ